MMKQSAWLNIRSMFEAGDVVHFYSSLAGKGKYHICLIVGCADGIHEFLFVNSSGGYDGDITFSDGEIPGLPKSKTESTSVSFSQLIRVKANKMALWNPEVKGAVPPEIIERLLEHAKHVPTLNVRERTRVVLSLESILAKQK